MGGGEGRFFKTAAEDSCYALLDSPLRMLISIEPKWITFDSDKSARDRQGLLTEVEKTPRATSDAVRMNAERLGFNPGARRLTAPIR